MRKPSPAMIVAIVALFVALGGAGMAATGDSFILGQSNTAGNVTLLTGTVNGDGALRVHNASSAAASRAIVGRMTSASAAAGTAGVVGSTASTNSGASGVLGVDLGGGPAVSATVAPGAAPLAVNSSTKVTNLNADLLDGLTSSDFLQSGASAGGGLSGTYPSPSIAGGSIGVSQLSTFGNPDLFNTVSAGAPFVIHMNVSTGSFGSSEDIPIYDADAPVKFLILDAWMVGESGDTSVLWFLANATGGGSAILSAGDQFPGTGEVERLSGWNPISSPDYRTIAQGGTLEVHVSNPNPTPTSSQGDLYILAMPLS
jgi:hypothetical protein